MTHPEELLAGYVDGSLSAKERAAVDAHLAGCARCSRGPSSAQALCRRCGRWRRSRRLPGSRRKRSARRGGVRRSAAAAGTPRWYRIGGAVAAAAAGLLVLTLVLPHIGQGGGSSGAVQHKDTGASRESGPVTALSTPSMIEIRHVNYDNTSLSELTSSYQSDNTGGGAIGPAAAPAPVPGSQAQTDEALACVTKSAPDQRGDLQSLIRARFQGTPAYLAVFLEGPGAGQPADAVTVWVFATDDCRILSFSSAKL